MCLVEDADDSSDSGYLTDDLGQPYARITLTDSWSFTASHECLEMLVNHFGDRMVPARSLKGGMVSHPLQVPEVAASVDATRLTNIGSESLTASAEVKDLGIYAPQYREL